MQEIRFHGRGGQGTVLASIALAKAYFAAGFWVQTFPVFGSERRGAPVEAYLRLDTGKIHVRSNVYEPDHVVVQDLRLFGFVDVLKGLKPGGWVLVNAPSEQEIMRLNPSEPGRPGRLAPYRVAWIDASKIALGLGLGGRTQPITNTAMMGAFARIMGAPSLNEVVEAIRLQMPAKIEENVEAARTAWSEVSIVGTSGHDARADSGLAAGLAEAKV